MSVRRIAHLHRWISLGVCLLVLACLIYVIVGSWWDTSDADDLMAAQLSRAADQARRRNARKTEPKYRPAERWLTLEGAANARDIGGYRTADGRSTRWNRVYRSGDLSGLTAAGCEAFESYGIRRVVDFRNRIALSSAFGGDADCVFEAAEMSLLPIRGDVVETGKATYLELLHGNADSVRQTFQLIADPENLPLLYHCTAGKDRTGIVTALLLSLLGVDRDTIVEECDLSIPVAGSVRREQFMALLDDIDAKGGIERYLASMGIDSAVQEALRAQLLE